MFPVALAATAPDFHVIIFCAHLLAAIHPAMSPFKTQASVRPAGVMPWCCWTAQPSGGYPKQSTHPRRALPPQEIKAQTKQRFKAYSPQRAKLRWNWRTQGDGSSKYIPMFPPLSEAPWQRDAAETCRHRNIWFWTFSSGVLSRGKLSDMHM